MFSSHVSVPTLKPLFSHSNPSLFSHHRLNALSIPHALRFERLQSQPKFEDSSALPVGLSHSPPQIVEETSDFPAKAPGVRPIMEESSSDDGDCSAEDKHGNNHAKDAGRFDEGKRIPGFHVPRQKHISVSKVELLDGILAMFNTQESVDDFLRVSLCLDSIIHAEHKGILEEMRNDYALTQPSESKEKGASVTSEENFVDSLQPEGADKSSESGSVLNEQENEKIDKPLPFHYSFDLSFLLRLSATDSRKNSTSESRIAVAARFQRSFMKLLHNARFEELSVDDLLLTSALNTDYLLTLPIYVDWKKASDSKAIIFRRGYATERQKGLLIVEKLDYLQSRLLQRVFVILSRPLEKIGSWINEAIKNAIQTKEIQGWIEGFKLWLKELSLPQGTFSFDELLVNGMDTDDISDSDPPIWLAAQRAIPRYEGLLSSVLGSRGRLLRKLLMWIGIIPSAPETSFTVNAASESSEPYLRPNSLSRISLGDIWKPASKESCGNDRWKMFKTAVSILFSQSVLQEPAFEELILLYTEEMGEDASTNEAEVPSLQLQIYERIPIPDLLVIFPHKKLSFRLLDTSTVVMRRIAYIMRSFERCGPLQVYVNGIATKSSVVFGQICQSWVDSVRLDVASILGLLAFFVNYKFEDILSSPSAILLDVIAISALIIYVTRVALGYKQTWDRYQLLVNKTLYEKTLASGFGVVHFLLDASEQQQYKDSILAYALLLRADEHEVASRKSIRNACERFMYDKFNEKVEMPIDKAVDALIRLGLVAEIPMEESFRLQALPCSQAYEALKRRWDSLLG